ncbi:MAG: helix-turn-helix transcriptional regulator [Bacteroidota bacterium]
MMNNDNINWFAMSDTALVGIMGLFVKHHRLKQNKTQEQLAVEAGINRSTLSLFENGESTNLLTFVQLLRALKLLNIFQEFQVKTQYSPIQLAKLEKSQRIRASRSGNIKSKPKSNL